MANIARAILEGAGCGAVSSDLYGDYDFSASAIAESSYMSSACATLFTDIMEAEQAYMKADIIGAATIIAENATGNEEYVQAISEGVFKDGIERIKNAFKKFIAKVKEFYKNIINWFKAMFSNAEDFVKNFGDELKTKASKVKGYTYKGFKYDVKKGDAAVNSYATAVEGHMKGLIGAIDFVNNNVSKDDLVKALEDKKLLSGDFKADDNPSASEAVEKWMSEYSGEGKGDDATEVREELIKVYRNDDSEKIDIENFEGNSVQTMLDFLKSSGKTISTINSQLKKFEDHTNSIIKKLNSVKEPSGKEDDQTEQSKVSNCSYISGILSAFLNLYKVPCNVRIDMYKAISSEWLGALKGFYRYKPAKESYGPVDADAYAMLESYVLEGKDCDDDDDDDDKGGKGDGEEPAAESTIASILEAANRYR